MDPSVRKGKKKKNRLILQQKRKEKKKYESYRGGKEDRIEYDGVEQDTKIRCLYFSFQNKY